MPLKGGTTSNTTPKQPSLYRQMNLIMKESSLSADNTRSSRGHVAETVREFVRNVEGNFHFLLHFLCSLLL